MPTSIILILNDTQRDFYRHGKHLLETPDASLIYSNLKFLIKMQDETSRIITDLENGNLSMEEMIGKISTVLLFMH